jgi:hypothetical protein
MLVSDDEGVIADIVSNDIINLNANLQFEPFQWPEGKYETQAQPEAQNHFIQQLKRVLFPDDEKYQPLIEENLTDGVFKCLDTKNNRTFIKFGDDNVKFRGRFLGKKFSLPLLIITLSIPSRGCDALIVPTKVRGVASSAVNKTRVMLELKKNLDGNKMVEIWIYR